MAFPKAKRILSKSKKEEPKKEEPKKEETMKEEPKHKLISARLLYVVTLIKTIASFSLLTFLN